MSNLIIVRNLKKTCDSCPAQWEGRTNHGEFIYIRKRFGWLTVTVARVQYVAEEHGDEYDGSLTKEEMLEVCKDLFDFSNMEYSEI